MSTADRRMAPIAADSARDDDEGAVLVYILGVVALMSFLLLPVLPYLYTVLKSSETTQNLTEAQELVEGGNWTALSLEGDLYDACDGRELSGQIDGVTTSCEVLRVERLRPADKVPFEVATLEADQPSPVGFGAGQTYTNPNTASDPSVWIANGDATTDSEFGKLWLPQLPVQAASDVFDTNSDRDEMMPDGSFDGPGSDCRVLFPGTYAGPVVINTPAYFTSGIYYFTEPITLLPGADVVVGNGSTLGCTNEYEAIAALPNPPDPLNISGLGGTIVLGGNGRIVIDDSSGSGDISFVMNQRYVAETDTSVYASKNVSIISVNGADTGTAGDSLYVPGVIDVPASTVGVDGDPWATDSGYSPSLHAPGVASPPDPPVITSAKARQDEYRRNGGNWDGVWDGRLTVSWTEPEDNGGVITNYIATDLRTGLTCSPPAPTIPNQRVQTSCTIEGLPHFNNGHQRETQVVAVNAAGTSSPSSIYRRTGSTPSGDRVDLYGSGEGTDQAWERHVPTPPRNAAVGTGYNNGMAVTWEAPTDDGGSPIVGYRVTATDVLTSAVVECDARWNEESCVLLVADGLTLGSFYDIEVTAYHVEGPGSAWESSPEDAGTNVVWLPGGDFAPGPLLVTPSAGSAILDLTARSSTKVAIDIEGYIAVPQGRVEISASDPALFRANLKGGIVAGRIDVDPSITPSQLTMYFDNPEAQKQMRITSRSTSDTKLQAVTIVKVNKSGSIKINARTVQ